ncbi:MAG: recombinase family protein [Candidatus Rhabdochlamydia sp.]
MRYVIFSRVSTKLQTVENQIRECVDYVKSNMQTDDEIVRFDEPETSSRIPMDERTKLQAMLNFVKKGDVLVIYKLDRLARDGEELVYIYRSKLIKKGIKVVSLYEPHIDNANIHIYAFLGETERNNIRIRTISGLKQKQSKMEKVGACWYGYKTDETKLQTHKPDCHSFGKPYLLIPEENEQQQVKLMLELHNQGLSYGEIVNELEAKGFRNRKGNPLHKSTVYRVVHRLKTS